MDVKGIVIVINRCKLFADLNLNGQFLFQFSFKAIPEGFSLFQFASGKFPEGAKPIVRLPLGNKIRLPVGDHRDDNLNWIRPPGLAHKSFIYNVLQNKPRSSWPQF